MKLASNGKGISKELAIASAYAEMAERFSAGMEPEIQIAPFRKLSTSGMKSYDRVSNYKYMNDYSWSHQDAFTNVLRIEDMLKAYPFTKGQFEYAKLNSELLRHWVSGYSLVNKKVVKVPILFIKWISSTNGLASGNTIEEAIIQGACEIFERDAMIRYLRSDLVAPSIIHETIKNETIQDILKYFRYNNIDVVIKDISNSMYPVYAIMTFNQLLPKHMIGYNTMKSGSSFDSDEAITRCFTERMQGTTFEMEMSEGDISKELMDDRHLALFFRGVCPINLDKFKDGDNIEYNRSSIEETGLEIEECIKIAKSFSTDMIVIDHTHPVLKFPTARVIMPGLSDFMKWWDDSRLNMDFICKIENEEEAYERNLMRVLKTFG